MASRQYQPSSKLIHAPVPPLSQYSNLTTFQSDNPINSSLLNEKSIIKELRRINLLNELYPIENNKTHIQETVEIIPQPYSYERIFYSYIDNHTDIRSREYIQLNHNIEHDHRFKLNFYSTTLYIFPKQRNEKFISEIHYIPEHITIKYKTTLEILATTLTSSSSSSKHYYENIHNFYHLAKDIFYRI